MHAWIRPNRFNVAILIITVVMVSTPRIVVARSPVKLQKFSGSIDSLTSELTRFELSGNASHLGKFVCYGEVAFQSAGEDGGLVGLGVAVFTAANGDQLVGLADWEVGPEAGGNRETAIHFSWRDSIKLNDGTVVTNTGRFVNDRPPGLVVIAIIAILIGMLLPAIQK
jgi:hypothetical protein